MATPLSVAPTYWREMVAARGGEAPTIASLYGKVQAMLVPGRWQSARIDRAGTLEIWESLAASSFRGEP